MKKIIIEIKRILSNRKAFMKEILSKSSDSSSKRYIMVGSFYVLALLALLNQIFGFHIDQIFPITFGGLAAGTAITNAVESIKKPKDENH